MTFRLLSHEQVHMIPALTLYRPWPALILRAGKNVENRTWRTNYRGPLLLHAGQRWDHSAVEFASTIWTAGSHSALDWIPQDPDAHPTGLVGAVRLYDCHRAIPSRWAAPGQWHWMLEDPYEFADPIPCTGKQQLWSPGAELMQAIKAALRAVAP